MACRLVCAGSSSFGATLYFTTAKGLIGYNNAGFTGSFARNGTVSTGGDSFSNPAVSESWSGSMNLGTGQLRTTASAANNGSDPDFNGGVTDIIVGFGDTITYAGTPTPGQTINAVIDLSGSWNTAASGLSTVENNSYLAIRFFRPGTFQDTGNIFGTSDIFSPNANTVAQTFWGIGPNVTPYAFGGPTAYDGLAPNFPSTITMPVDATLLASGFQFSVILQTQLSGNTNGPDQFSWGVDLGHTLNISLQGPAGVTLSAAGGLPVGPSEAPEPGSLILVAIAGGLLGAARFRGRIKEAA